MTNGETGTDAPLGHAIRVLGKLRESHRADYVDCKIPVDDGCRQGLCRHGEQEALGDLLILSGLDKVVETRLTDTMPPWLVNLTTRF